MNTAQRFTSLTLAAAALAAAFLVHGAQPARVAAQQAPAAHAAVVQLPRVEITAKRLHGTGLRVVQLPAVEVIGRASWRVAATAHPAQP